MMKEHAILCHDRLVFATLFGWPLVLTVCDGGTCWIAWLVDVVCDTGTPVSIVSITSTRMSDMLNWLNPYMVSFQFPVSGATSKLESLHSPAYKSNLLIAWLIFSLYTCPTCSISSAGKRQLRLSWWSGGGSAIKPLTTLSKTHCLCRFKLMRETLHQQGSLLQNASRNDWSNFFLSSKCYMR